MANPPPARPWFRLGSIARPAPVPALTPEPTVAPQARPPLARPAFRPVIQTQTEATQQPQAPPAGQTEQPQPQPPVPPPVTAASPPPPPATGGVASVTASPERRASVPTSPATKTSPPPTTLSVGAVSSVPSSPKPKAAPSTSSVPTSPAKTASLPTSPTKTVQPATIVAPTASVQTSPAAKAVTTSPPAQKPATATTVSPRAMKPAVGTPPQSPKLKPSAPPPSPLALPPAQLKSQTNNEPKIPAEAEQKTVLVQKTIEKAKGWFNGDTNKDVSDSRKPPPKDGEKKEKLGGHGYHKKLSSSDSEEHGMRIITIAGENKGAFMELIQSPHKHGFGGNLHHLQDKKGESRTVSDGSEWHSYSSSSEEGNDQKKKGKSHKAKANPMHAFLNSNVQGINSSIMYNSSCTHHDPGVHLGLSKKPAGAGGGLHVKEHGNGYDS